MEQKLAIKLPLDRELLSSSLQLVIIGHVYLRWSVRKSMIHSFKCRQGLRNVGR
jgi:hypothetical protein